MPNAFKPSGYNSVSPYLVTKHAGEVINFLRDVLDAEPLRRYDMPDGTIMHAEVRVDDTVVMIGEAGENWPATPCHIHVYVPDVDRTYQLALERGGEAVQPPQRKGDDPDRRGGVADPGGNTWWFSTQQDDG